ncbi:hypothetical protein EOL73_02315 [Candidatus Saccharibacteria bacterium]|nr:hypothetical protein [Candidatus Saccharibacteria bacterium]
MSAQTFIETKTTKMSNLRLLLIGAALVIATFVLVMFYLVSNSTTPTQLDNPIAISSSRAADVWRSCFEDGSMPFSANVVRTDQGEGTIVLDPLIETTQWMIVSAEFDWTNDKKYGPDMSEEVSVTSRFKVEVKPTNPDSLATPTIKWVHVTVANKMGAAVVEDWQVFEYPPFVPTTSVVGEATLREKYDGVVVCIVP